METRTSTEQDVEKGPPLYEEIEARDVPPAANVITPPTGLSTPAPEATAEEVRKYLAEVMQIRGMAPARAEEVARSWTLGTGQELRSYTVAAFREMFGMDGWVIYKDVRTTLYVEEMRARHPRAGSGDGCGVCCGLFFLLVTLGLIGGGIALNVVEKGDHGGAGIFMIVLGGVCLPLAIGMVVSKSNPTEDADGKARAKAEQELKEQWDKTPAT